MPIPFYQDSVHILFDPVDLPPQSFRCDDNAMRAYYRSLQTNDAGNLVRSLLNSRNRYSLNDWLTYILLQKSLEYFLPRSSRNQRIFLEWYYLGKAGFDTRLACQGQDLYLYVHTQEIIYGLSFLRDGEREFINLNRPEGASFQHDSLQIFSVMPWEGTRPFSFAMEKLPDMRAKPLEKTLRFTYRSESHAIPVSIDTGLTGLMNDYPMLSEQEYLRVAFSPSARESLLPPLRKLTHGKSQAEAIRVLVAFTRTAFVYMEDEKQFGFSKPMVAEETLLYSASDCEDRVAILYQLVSELLGLPMIVLAYPEHLTLAVALNEEVGPPIRYKGTTYYICDPTGPPDTEEIGSLPEKYNSLPFEIIGE